MTNAERNRQTRSYRKEHGLCQICGKPVEPGKQHCSDCLRKSRDDYHELVNRGICPVCRKRDAMTHFKTCAICAEKKADSVERYRSKPGVKDYINARLREQRRAQRQQRKEQGVCVRCGRPVTDGHTQCAECRSYKSKYDENARRTKAKIPFPRSEWVENGYCYHCGSLNDNYPKRFCKKCSEEAIKNFAKRNQNDETHPWKKQNNLVFKGKEEHGYQQRI